MKSRKAKIKFPTEIESNENNEEVRENELFFI